MSQCVAITSPGGPYVVEVTSAPTGGVAPSGNFVLNASFGPSMAVIDPINSGTLAARPPGTPAAQVSTTLVIGQGGLDSFVLDGSAANAGTDAILPMTVLDFSGKVAFTLSTPAALAESATELLAAGTYTIDVGADSPTGQALPSLAYRLFDTRIIDPIKPYGPTGSGGVTTGR